MELDTSAPHVARGGYRKTIERNAGRLVTACSDFLEQHRSICWLLLFALYIPLVLVEAHSHPLTNDEIYTVHIAQAPTIRRMLWLAREIDLHPPLHYLLQRVALHLDLPRWLASRLPSMIAGLIATCAIFSFAARRLGNLLGLVAVTVFWSSPAISICWQNRPYALWICFLALLLIAWERATSPFRSPLDIAAVFICSLLMISDHLFGVACLLPFALAEAQRLRQRFRPDPALWIALFTPALLGLGLYYQLHHLAANSFPQAHMPSLDIAGSMYGSLAAPFFFMLSVCVMTVAYLPPVRLADTFRLLQLRTDEGVLLYSLLALPLLLLLAAAMLHVQFWERYASCAVLPLALLTPWFLYRRANAAYSIAFFAVLFLIGSTIARIVVDYPSPGSNSAGLHQTGRQPIYLASLNPNLPIVTASAMTFTEMSDHEPLPIARRITYLTDRPSELRYSGYTLFDNEAKIRSLLNLPSQTAPLHDFLTTHAAFYMIGTYTSPDDWLPRALADQGTHLQYLGKFVSTYDDDDLYLVTIPQ